jgi:hypothetical protein
MDQSDPKVQLLILRGSLLDLPEAQQAQVKECAGKLREVLGAYPGTGLIAMALVGLEEGSK